MILGGLILSQVSAPTPVKRRLAGRATFDGAPAKRRVVVQKRGTLEYVTSTMSDSVTGNWEIRGLPIADDASLIVSYIDDTGNFDPIAFDNVSQVE